MIKPEIACGVFLDDETGKIEASTTLAAMTASDYSQEGDGSLAAMAGAEEIEE